MTIPRTRQITDPKPLAEIRRLLEPDDNVSQALAAFAAARLSFTELNLVLDAAEEQSARGNAPAPAR
jgi:hypothetical protein